MKKVLLAYAALIIAVILLAVIRSDGNFTSSLPFFQGATATLNDRKFDLTVAKSEEEKQKGLAGKDSLNDNSGMLFVFEEKGTYPFWMKDMKFPIDIIFIDDDTVVEVIKNAPIPEEDKPLTIYRASQEINYVLEINANLSEEYEIQKGTKVEFNNL